MSTLLPRIRDLRSNQALILSMADDLDAKVHQVRHALGSDATNGEFTGDQPRLGRVLSEKAHALRDPSRADGSRMPASDHRASDGAGGRTRDSRAATRVRLPDGH